MKLFIFEHCPFCVKAMMIVGLKELEVEFVYLQNDDVEARIEKVGANLVPILQKPDGSYMAESLDIVEFLDNVEGTPVLGAEVQADDIASWRQSTYRDTSCLLYPRWLLLDLSEFATQSAKDWFRKNKSAMIEMSFEQALANSAEYLENVNKALQELTWISLPSERADALNYDDINLFPFLRNLTIIKGLVYPARVRQYLNEVAGLTQLPLYDDVAV